MKKFMLIFLLLFSYVGIFADENSENETTYYYDEPKTEQTDDVKKSKGSHFILEGDLGFAYPTSPLSDYYYLGLSFDSIFGVGFKVPNTPFRLYGIFELGFGNFKVTRTDSIRGELYLQNFYFMYSFGARLYYAKLKHRAFFDLNLGKVYNSYSFNEKGMQRDLTASEDYFAMKFAVGYQYRLNYRFSVGGKLDYYLPIPDKMTFYNVNYTSQQYEEDITWINLSISFVYHF